MLRVIVNVADCVGDCVNEGVELRVTVPLGVKNCEADPVDDDDSF